MKITCTNSATKRLQTPETREHYDDPLDFTDGPTDVRKAVGKALIESYPAIEAASEADTTITEATAETTGTTAETAETDGEARSETPDDLAARINDAEYVTLQRAAGQLDSVQGNAGAVSIRHGLHDADTERVRAAFAAIDTDIG
jgi:hypothetical protein